MDKLMRNNKATVPKVRTTNGSGVADDIVAVTETHAEVARDAHSDSDGVNALQSFTCGNLRVTHQRGRAMVALNGGVASAHVLEAALKSLQLNDATVPGRAVHNDAMRLLWHGPGLWLAVSDTLRPAMLIEKLHGALGDIDAALIDLSDARTVVRLSGKPALDALATGCPVDTHALPPDSSFASLFWTYNVLVDVRDAECVELYVFRSLGQALWEHLQRVSVEFAYATMEDGM